MTTRTHMLLAVLLLLSAPAHADLHVLIIEGLGGEERYSEQFAEQVSRIETAAQTLASGDNVRVFRGSDENREEVLEHLGNLAAKLDDDDSVHVYLVGHGSYDDHDYKFNIAGPDLTDADIVGSLAGLATPNQVLINTSSASGAIAEKVEDKNLLLITATKSGVERHATRFGVYFALALSDSTADIDKNRIITAQEAFDFAERQVSDYFERNDRLATEHPRLEGERANRISLARLGAAAPASDDAELRKLIADRDALAASVEELRLARETMPTDEYQSRLLESMLEVSMAEEAIERREQELEIEQ